MKLQIQNLHKIASKKRSFSSLIEEKEELIEYYSLLKNDRVFVTDEWFWYGNTLLWNSYSISENYAGYHLQLKWVDDQLVLVFHKDISDFWIHIEQVDVILPCEIGFNEAIQRLNEQIICSIDKHIKTLENDIKTLS